MTTSYRARRRAGLRIGQRSDRRTGRRTRPAGTAATLPWGLAAATVLAQIAYPLTRGEALRVLTVATVVLFFLASATHAWVHRGGAWALRLLGVSAGGGLLAEAVGVRTGYPFGAYDYTGSLGPQFLGVPLVVPMAWAMFAYPAFVVARQLTRRYVPLVGGAALTSWDLFLDPQMVAAGHWRWASPAPEIPGVPGIPLTNLAGWLVVAVAMMVVLDRLLPRQRDADEAQPAVLFLWTWVAGVVGNLFFFDRPSVALVGGVAMGLVAVPYARSLWSGRWPRRA